MKNLNIHPTTEIDLQKVINKINSMVNTIPKPIIVALDGRSGTGKSTLAEIIAERVGGICIETDYFWSGGTNEIWDARSPKEKSELAIDWKRLRKEVLEPLSRGQTASWHQFDFKKGYGLAEKTITKQPAKVVIIDGAYSTRPELRDLIDLKIFVDVPKDEHRRARLVKREGEKYMADWHARWDVAEDYYFANVSNRDSFDLFVRNH